MKQLSQLVISRIEWLIQRAVEYDKENFYCEEDHISEGVFRKWFDYILGWFMETLKCFNKDEVNTNVFFIPMDTIDVCNSCSEDFAFNRVLTLLKYYRYSYLDLISQAEFRQEETEVYCHFVELFFDRIEIKCGVRCVNRHSKQFIKVEQDLWEQYEKFKVTLESIGDGVIVTDIEGKVTFMNPVAEAFTGFKEMPYQDQLISELFNLVDEKTRKPVEIPIFSVLREGKAIEGTNHNLLMTREGKSYAVFNSASPICKNDKTIIGAIMVFHDVTMYQKAQETIRYQASHDALTGLPNRSYLNVCLKQAMDEAQIQKHMIAVIFLDLDDFKNINDVLGHNIGDGILSEIAQRIKEMMRKQDTFSRWGGDEFVILLPNIKRKEDVLKMSKRILSAFEAPFEYNDYKLYVTASIGIAFYPQHGKDANTVFKNADMAMYRAKEKGRNTFQVYSAQINEQSLKKLMLTNDLRHALDRNEFVLYYQPQVNIYTGRVVGMEALIRWQHPELGLVSPVSFIPLAEDMGLIVPIGEWVLYTACTQNKMWQDSGLPPLRVAVNLSAHQLQQSGFVERVMSVLEETGLEPNYLDLEITESVALQNIELTIEKLNALQERGIHISMDDFGTGYSSLSYLMKLPINTLKIDRSFVKEINTNTKKVAIADAIVSMAHSLKFKVIAEGVETQEQLQCMYKRECDEVQGYIYSKPLAKIEFEKLLESDKRLDFECQKINE